MTVIARVSWAADRTRLGGSVVERRRLQNLTYLDVRWDDGRRGSFIERHEPPELRYEQRRPAP